MITPPSLHHAPGDQWIGLVYLVGCALCLVWAAYVFYETGWKHRRERQDPPMTNGYPDGRARWPSVSQWLHGWSVFFELLVQQRRKAHGKGRRDWLTAIYVASCGRQIADLQHRAPGRMPIEGRVAQWLAHGSTTDFSAPPPDRSAP